MPTAEDEPLDWKGKTAGKKPKKPKKKKKKKAGSTGGLTAEGALQLSKNEREQRQLDSIYGVIRQVIRAATGLWLAVQS